MKLNEILNLNKIEKNILINISTMLGMLVVLMTASAIIYQFMAYIFDMQWFYYWSIDSIFYVKGNSDIINGMLYGFSILCLILFFSLAMYGISKNAINEDGSKSKVKLSDKLYFLLIFLFVYLILVFKDLYFYDFSIGRIVFHIIIVAFLLVLMNWISNKVVNFFNSQNYNKLFNISIKDLFLYLLVIIFGLFISMVMLGNVIAFSEKDYKVLNNSEECKVILYSTVDYYVIAKCEISNSNTIKIYRNTQEKINNYNISYQTMTFSKIDKK